MRFRKGKFAHDFYESSKRDEAKDRFSWRCAERFDWIKGALHDPAANATKAGTRHANGMILIEESLS